MARIGRSKRKRRHPALAALLEAHSLEEIIGNVRRNTIFEPEARQKCLVDEARRTYVACVGIAAKQSVADVVRRSGFSYARVKNWEYGHLPRILIEHTRSLTPRNRKERVAFAYLLGLHSSDFWSDQEGKRLFRPNITDAALRARALETGRSFLGDELVDNGLGLRFPDRTFPKILNYCLRHDFETYVARDDERVAYLQGCFEISESTLRHSGTQSFYKLTRRNAVLLERLARTLFEVGVIPTVNNDGGTVKVVGVQNLDTIQELQVDRNRKNRRAVAAYLAQPHPRSYEVREYYRIRAEVRRRLNMGAIPNWEQLSRDLGGLPDDTVKCWVADIVRRVDPDFASTKITPFIVKNFEGLLARFGIPNVFEQEGHAMIGSKLFLNVAGDVFYVPPNLFDSYLRQTGYDSAEGQKSLYQAVSALKAGKESPLETLADRNGVITALTLKRQTVAVSGLLIDVDGKVIPFSEGAIRDYAKLYDLDPTAIGEEDVAFLREQYGVKGSLKCDLTFKIKWGTVVGVSLKDSVGGANRTSMAKHSEGVRGSSHLSVYGIF